MQDAVYDALNVSAFTTVASVWTDVPQGTPFPYAWLTWGDPAEEPQDAFGRLAVVSHLELHVFSSYEGDDEALDLLHTAAGLLHHGALTVTGWAVPYVGRTGATLSVVEFNGLPLRIGILRVNVHAVKAA